MNYIDIIYLVIIFLVVVFLVYHPKKKQEAELKNLQNNLKVGDKIITYSGLSGKITKIEEDKILLEVSPSKTETYIEKWAIAGIDDRN